MKRFRLSTIFLALALCTAVGFAQTDDGASPAPPPQNHSQMQRGHRGRGMRGGRGNNFLQSLNLSKDQKDKIRPILQDQREQMRKVFQDQSLSREQRMEKMRQMHENTASRVRALLTPDQQKTFDAHEQEMKERMQKRMQQRRDRQPQGGDNN